MISGYNSQVTGQTAHYKDSKKVINPALSLLHNIFNFSLHSNWSLGLLFEFIMSTINNILCVPLIFKKPCFTGIIVWLWNIEVTTKS